MKKRNLFIPKLVLSIIVIFVMGSVSVACDSVTEDDKKENTKLTETQAIAYPSVTDTEQYEKDDKENLEGKPEEESEGSQPVESSIPTDIPENSAAVPEATLSEEIMATPEPTPTQTVPAVMTEAPTPTASASQDTIHKDIAESFFHGEWESESGMIYIFDGAEGSVALKEKNTGDILLTGTYESTTEDFSEYALTMTFNGETDTFIAWKYSDTGAVRLIIEETGATYDLLWRPAD